MSAPSYGPGAGAFQRWCDSTSPSTSLAKTLQCTTRQPHDENCAGSPDDGVNPPESQRIRARKHLKYVSSADGIDAGVEHHAQEHVSRAELNSHALNTLPARTLTKKGGHHAPWELGSPKRH